VCKSGPESGFDFSFRARQNHNIQPVAERTARARGRASRAKQREWYEARAERKVEVAEDGLWKVGRGTCLEGYIHNLDVQIEMVVVSLATGHNTNERPTGELIGVPKFLTFPRMGQHFLSYELDLRPTILWQSRDWRSY
jgi:hypothetical protein